MNSKKIGMLFLFLALQCTLWVGVVIAFDMIDSGKGIPLKEFIFTVGIVLSIALVALIFWAYRAIVRVQKLSEESKKAELISQHLRTINKNFSGVLNQIGAIIYVIDIKNGEIIFANNYAISKFGEIVGKKAFDATANQYDGDLSENAPQFYEYKNTLTNEWYAVTQKESLWMEDQIVKISVCLDITPRKDAEERLRVLNERLQEMVDKAVADIRKKDRMLIQQSKMAAMGEMIGAIAHQWRQPLNAISIMIQDLKLSYDMNEMSSEYVNKLVEDMLGQTRYMSKTIDDFRNFFRPDKPKEIFTVQKTVEDVLKISSSALSSARIVIETKMDEKPILIDGYENEFKQVVLNLISNAKDAIIGNGNVKEGKISIEAFKDGANGVLRVSDNGGGIRDDVLSRVFEPYFTTKGATNGTGIGLYMSKMIIENNMGGSIVAYNESSGAVFEIILTACDGSAG